MPSDQRPAIVWYRNDLRVSDHAALAAAIATGRPVLPVYVLDDDAAGPWRMGGAARWWLHHSLAALTNDLVALGAPLILRRGASAPLMAQLARETGAAEVFTGGSAEPWARALDRTTADMLRQSGIEFHRMRTTMLFNPEQIRTKTGGPYGVYTPYANACLGTGGPPPPLPAPERIRPAPSPVPSPVPDKLQDWDLLPTRPDRSGANRSGPDWAGPDWAGGLRSTWTPGEAGALARLHRFLGTAVQHYDTARDRPDLPGTSMLSPHLRFGEISPAQIWHAAHALPANRPLAERGRATFIKELLWREFSLYQLWHHPDLPEQPLRRDFAIMPWRDDAGGLQAWQQGRTGIPIVDAGMRQLWQTGWMHNRVRMIVASFLVKHLLIPWQSGEAWFWDTLVDADLASNAVNWQWVAGCGVDAAPYFRIFNPVLQGRKFDPDGTYVRRYVPELAHLDTRFIHAPWESPIPARYPAPVVGLAEGRARALDAFALLKNHRAGSQNVAD